MNIVNVKFGHMNIVNVKFGHMNIVNLKFGNMKLIFVFQSHVMCYLFIYNSTKKPLDHRDSAICNLNTSIFLAM